MNSIIETLNHWGEGVVSLAWPMLWQSSLLIAVLFVLDFVLRRKVRAAIRYALWLVVLVKLILPPSLALPTGVGWWLRSPAPPPLKPPAHAFVVTYGNAVVPNLSLPRTPPVFVPPPPPPMSAAAWTLVACGGISVGLLAWLLIRWGQVARKVRRATVPEKLTAVSDEARSLAGLRSGIRLKLTDGAMSPAVCGLFRPVILLPRTLVERLSAEQLRAVLLHELIHLRRGDVWVNCAQALLQIVYWWHPLLWLANARIRRVREEAVDDAVMLALADDADTYAPTLLEVAKLAFNRPLVSLGLVGILESRSALRQRIERLVNFHAPRKAGLTLVSLLGILAFTALAVPMGKAPVTINQQEIVQDRGADKQDVSAEKLVQDGKLLFESGKLGEAEAAFKAALAINSENAAALYYLNLTKEARTKAAHSNGRQTIVSKLDRIRLDNIQYDNLPLGEVIKSLSERVRQRDPEKKGINFIVATNIERDISITINPELSDVRLADVLDIIMKVADKPIRYSIEDYGIIFSLKAPDAGPLYTRSFKVDPNTFYQGLESVGSLDPGTASKLIPRTNSTEAVSVAARNSVSVGVRKFFDTLGVTLYPPKAVFWNDRKGELLVRATLQDLDIIEKAIEVVNGSPPETQAVTNANEIVHERTMTGIYSDPQFRAVLRELEQRDGAIVPGAEATMKTNASKPPQMNTYSVNHNTFYQGLESVGAHDSSATNLYMRMFKVDPNTFYYWLESVGALDSSTISKLITRTNPPGLRSPSYQMETVTVAVRNFFTSLGVNFSQPGTSVLWNDRMGELLVRATLTDLDIIKKAIKVLNYQEPQVNIKVRFVDLGTLSTTNAIASSSNPSGVFPGSVAGTAIAPRTAGQLRTNGLRNADTASSFKGILTASQFKEVLKTLEQREGADVFPELEATTLMSGRQVHFEISDLKTIVTGLTTIVTNGRTIAVYQTQPMPFGPALDVVPYVSADGYTIQMTLIPSLTEFLGYENPGKFVGYDGPGKFVPEAQPASGKGSAAIPLVALPMPRFRLYRATNNAAVWDGQTVLLGGLITTHGTNSIQNIQNKRLIIFVTPTIIDPAGNRVHSEDELPFSKNSIPPQPVASPNRSTPPNRK